MAAGPGDDEVDDGALDTDPSLLDPSSGLFAQPFFLAALSWRVIACACSFGRVAFQLLSRWLEKRFLAAS